jgi:hypothetical protein
MRKIVALPPDAPVELGDPSNQYYDPQKLAKRLGFKGFSWKAIHCDGRYNYFADAKHAAMSVDRIVLSVPCSGVDLLSRTIVG